MKTLFSAMLQALKKGENLVLCSIIASSGSTPRGKGAKMVVFENGKTVGTIGGGAVEYECTLLSKQVFKEKGSTIQNYNLSSNETADIGMICGGKVAVHFQYYRSDNAYAISIIEHIVTLLGQSKDTWLITSLSPDESNHLSVYESGSGFKFIDDNQSKYLQPLLMSKGMYRSEMPAYYVEPLTQTGTVYIFGGGHVAQELVPVIEHVGFRTVVFDDREQFASKSLFPHAVETIVGDFNHLHAHIELKPCDYVVIMTRGHQADYEILEQVMRTNVCYVGVIGSRHKKDHTFKRLIDAGISEEALVRIHTPIGLPIKGETPAEIAISIAGELILKRAEKNEVSG